MRHAHCADAAHPLADEASKGSAGCIALRSSASLPPLIPQHGPASGNNQAHHGRYSDRPIHWRTRLSGMSGTAMIFALMLGCVAFRWQRQPVIATASPPLVVTLQPLAAPPEPVEEVPEGPRQVERRQQKAQERLLPSPPDILLPRLLPLSSPTHDPVEPAQAVDPIPETMAPKSVPAPPAKQASSRQDMTWEAVLLGHLEKYRRYPATARNRREQGVTYVTFHMNRTGMVLSSRITRSSGSALLDRAALETLKRAQPLPPIPADRSDPLELSVPVEFFINR